MKKIIYPFLFLLVVASASCKKDNKNTPASSTLDLIKDSVFLYAKETYYWNDKLPSYETFKPRSYSGNTDLDALTSEVDALSQIAINPATNKPYEYYEPSPGYAKYSFIDDGSVSTELNGTKGDFGFAPVWIDIAGNDLRVKYVYAGSPADLKGIKRGDQIIAINGRTGSGLTYDGDNSGTNVRFVINAYTGSNPITMTLKRTDESTYDVSMSPAEYTLNPVLATKVINANNNRKIGYIVFNSFTSDENAKPKLDAAFGTFASAGITDLVVDLRYNGGGYVSTAQYLSNLIAPSSANGSLMYTEYYNQDLQKDIHPLLSKIYNIKPGDFSPANAANYANFAKAGSLNINRVFFIVSGSTASASELTINNLIPKMDVKLIGSTTYGKPVGFFAIDINKYQLYVPQFETKNSAGKGGYYAGMTPGKDGYSGAEAQDDVTRQFGDPQEESLATAINYVNTGTFAIAGKRTQSLSGKQTLSIEQASKIGVQLEGNKFRGMILNKPKK